ncbi:MAG: hypothetical protein R6V47_00845, partial [Candidatus Delongbacteria bacterium]
IPVQKIIQPIHKQEDIMADEKSKKVETEKKEEEKKENAKIEKEEEITEVMPEEEVIEDKDVIEPEEEGILEKFMDYEVQTKIGLICTLIFLLGLIFRWYWLNANWWLVLIIGAIGFKTLYTQMTDLKEEKPAEAKLAKYSFITFITLLVIRDLWITSYFSDLIRFLPVK